ncbi:MAG: M48 family metalloprotease [Proteobacteria bacterium]|nr:M48 family metalloprotease [Pseudomonadota bacterium]
MSLRQHFLILFLISAFSFSVKAKEHFDPIFTYQLSDEQLKPIDAKLKSILDRLLKGAEKLKNEMADPEERTKPAFDVDFDISYEHSRDMRANTTHVYNVQADPVTGRKKSPISTYRGLLEFVESEDELAGIIGHEMVHSKHGIDQNGKKLPVSSRWMQQRGNEFQADIMGAKIARAAGYDPRHVQKALARLAKFEDNKVDRSNFNNLGVEFLKEMGAAHPSIQERYNTFNGFLHFENRIASLDRAKDNPYDGWLEKYKRAINAPWSKDEPNRGMETFLKRLLELTDLKDKAPHEKIAFINHILFEEPRYQSLFYHGLMVDPHVNPNPVFSKITFDPERLTFEAKADKGNLIWNLPHYGVPLPSSAPTKEFLKEIDGEVVLAKVQEILGASPDKNSRLAANNLFHNVSKTFEPTQVRRLLTPIDKVYPNQSQWRFSPERILNMQNSLLAAPNIKSYDEYIREKLFMTPEQEIEQLMKLAKARVALVKSGKVEASDKELSLIFNSMESIPARYWTVDLSNDYVRILPTMHASQFGNQRSWGWNNWPGMNSGFRFQNESIKLDSAALRCLNGNNKYLRKMMGERDVPLSLRMIASHNYFHEKANKASYLPTIQSVGEYIHAYKDVDKLGAQVLNDSMVFNTVVAKKSWKCDVDSVDRLFHDLDFSWLKNAGKDKNRRITGEVLGFDVDVEMKAPGLNEIVQEFDKRGYADPTLTESLEKAQVYLKNSSVQFDIKYSEKLQREFMARVERDSLKPLSLEEKAKMHIALTQVGNTPFSDALAESVYLNPKFKCVECMEKALDQGKVWDFATRKKIHDRWFDLEGQSRLAKLPDNKARMDSFQIRLNHWFPEPSYERGDIVEDFSNHIQSSYAEAKTLDPWKLPRDTNNESAAARIFSAIRKEMAGDPKYPKRPMEFVKFLIGSGDFPKMPSVKMEDSDRDGVYKVKDPITGETMKTKGFTQDVIGPERIKKLFDSLSPELRAGVLSYYLSPPKGLLSNPKFSKDIKKIILSGVDSKHRADASLFLEALLHAQQKVQPHEVPLTVGYLLAQTGGKSRGVGIVLKEALVSQGAAGVSFGQKLYQRRMLPPDMLEDLADLQDKADPPSRLESYEQLIKRLDLKNPDAEIKLAKVLGSASAKVVLKVMKTDGEAAAWEAVKMLRPNFHRGLEVQEEMLREFVDYLEVHGDGRHRGLKPIFDDTFASLRRQSDLRTEPRVRAQVEKLYLYNAEGQKQAVDRHGYEWAVAQPKNQGAQEHLREGLVEGKTVKALSEADRAKIAPSLFEKEESILFKNLNSPHNDEDIYFERDRHFGNYIVDGKKITVIDYPLLTSINVGERKAVFSLLGNAEIGRSFGRSLPKVFEEDLLKVMREVDQDGATTVTSKYKEALKDWLSKKDAKKNAAAQVFELFSAMENRGIKIKESVHSYLTALGHLEGASHYLPKSAQGVGKLQKVVTDIVKKDLEPKLAQLTTFEKCQLTLSRLIKK